ncbi:HNH endonuclease signature motif containing protein [Paraburkholderia kirstenboschensis]|uniref:HNH endonuclease signature motif containing protein n=1 Tax=Paraburkholderia kirstenboschensis TaxID=1245436 RepID=UPI0013E2F62A|nr:HNH endonuclease signature motif containing protein [Paraburkholderia kirstenboschensis]
MLGFYLWKHVPNSLRSERQCLLLTVGQCAISGCDIPEALEAAHLRGRKWREGHNAAEDGILLRRDLHMLYDRELLDFGEGVALFSDRS